MTAIDIAHLSKSFSPQRRALDDVSLRIGRGEMVALIGPSGSGKSTLLRHVAGLACGDRDSAAGNIEVLGRPVQAGGRLARDIRSTRAAVGFVFQQFNLVGRLPLLTNVLTGTLGRVPLWRSLTRRFTAAERRQAMDALRRVGMADYAGQRASTLSGGQQQRGAIARALVQNASVILADEPIASLDPGSARRVMETLAEINAADGITVVVSLHQVGYARRFCRRAVALRDGRIVYDGPTAGLTPALLDEIYGEAVRELEDDAPAAPASVLRPPRPAGIPLHGLAAAGA